MQTPENNHASQARMKRGLELLESNGKQITENSDGSFQVPSQTSSKLYEVRLIGQNYVCTCPDFEFRGVESCKHIFAVRMMIATKTYLKEEPKPKVFAEDAIPCDKCGSIQTIRYGQSSGKQVFKCKDCQHKFREESLLKRAKFSPELVTLTLDLYFSGLSLRKIARNISDHFNIDIHFSTIYSWIERYIPIISQYVNTLAPQLSETWHADELFVRMRGSELKGNYQGMAFLWNVMDRETRFLLASRIAKDRDIPGSIKAFQEAVKNAHGQTPDTIRSDSLKAYGVGIKLAFEGKKVPEHIKNCGVRKRENNNRIERMNGTLRERTKVQRGWKSYETPLADGQRIAYNFVKPHVALKGHTPAQAGGLDVKGWKELLERAVKK
jgi:transposase-like protein/predicted nucleic acid-binding Zn finger protein